MATRRRGIKLNGHTGSGSKKGTARSIAKELKRINRNADLQGCSGLGNTKNKRRR